MSDDFDRDVEESLMSPPPKKKWTGWQSSNADFAESWKFDLEDKAVVVGKLTDFKTHAGKNDQNVYTLTQANGQRWSVWGATVIDQALVSEFRGSSLKYPLGTWVRIEFLGEKKNPKTGRNFNAFDVKTSETPPPSDE